MNSRTISSPLIRRPKSQILIARAILALAMLALLVVATSVWRGSTALKPAAETVSGPGYLAQNPELSAARSYAARSAFSPASFLAENPELSAARGYAATAAAGQENILAQNPELMVAAHYDATHEITGDAQLLAQNPELSVVRNYAAAAGATTPALADSVNIADRIQFQDRRDLQLLPLVVPVADGGWNMAARHEFHDRFWDAQK